MLNNQTESNKPTTIRKKLNPNKEFIPSNYQPDSPSKKLGLKINKYESTSEPGSANSFASGLKKNENYSSKKDSKEEEAKEKSKDSFQVTDAKTVQKNLSSDNLFDHFTNNSSEYPSFEPYQNQQQQYFSMSNQPPQKQGFPYNQPPHSKSLSN